jgi:hypothetical protein
MRGVVHQYIDSAKLLHCLETWFFQFPFLDACNQGGNYAVKHTYSEYETPPDLERPALEALGEFPRTVSHFQSNGFVNISF